MKKIKIINYISILFGFMFLVNDIMANENNAKYEYYLDDHIDGKKCEGYDFDPNKVVLIDLIGFDKYAYVVLDNGKHFRIYDQLGNCGLRNLEGEDSYKQLPEGCHILIGTTCISPPPANCKKVIIGDCFDDGVEQDYQIFQWEATNKGWKRMTSFTEYQDYEDNE